MTTWQSLNPATGEPLGTFTADSPDAVAERVKCARTAFTVWSSIPLPQRIRKLKLLRTALAGSAPDLARAVSVEIGKPYSESLSSELMVTLDGLDFLIRNSSRILGPRRITGGLNPRLVGFRRALIHRQPFGVVAILGTWNYPVFLNVLQIASALVAGNTVVWKPSELASFVAAKTVDVFRSAGFSEDVFQVVFGGPDTGAVLAAAGCDKYVLTGGTASGRALLAAIAHDLRPAVLELSGQDAAVVCADADLDAAARSLVWGAFTNCGQTCTAVRRIYYDASLESTFVPAFLANVAKLRVGNPLDPDVDIGPMRSSALVDRVEAVVRKAQSAGAGILAGGRRLDRSPGNFFAPTVLAGIDETSSLFDEDIFGPVTVLCPVADVHEGIARANRSRFALAASIWTRNRRTAGRLARTLDAGMVSVNAVVLPVGDPRLPFGGFKHSGYGRTHGAAGLLEMTAERVVAEYRPLPPGRGSSFPAHPAMAPLLEGLFDFQSGPWVKPKLKALGRLFPRLRRFLRRPHN